MRAMLSVVLVTLTLLGCENQTVDKEFDLFKKHFIDDFIAMHPEWGVYLGRYEYAGELTVPSEVTRKERSEFAKSYLKQLQEFDYKSLNKVNASDWWIIENQLESIIWYSKELKRYEWDPSSYNVARIIGLILNTEYAPIEKRLNDINQRLLDVPAVYESAIENITKPTLPHTKIAIPQNQGAVNLLEDRLVQEIESSSLTVDEKQVMQTNVESAVASIKNYIQWLSAKIGDLEKNGAKDFRIGEKLYEEKFALDIVSGYTAKEIYKLALQEKDRLHAEMIKLAEKLWPKYFEDDFPADSLIGVKRVVEEISKTHAEPAQFVKSVEQQIPELERFLVEKDLMDIDSEKPLVVRETPEYQRGFSVASIESPGPFDVGGNTYYNVQPLDGYSEEDAESFLREYNQYMMQILNIHEAIPGHYTQLVHSNKSPSLIKSIFGNGAMIEGWAVYTERMMLEEGYGDFNPELWLMYYKWNLRTVVNTILDYSVQVLGMEEQEALDLLMNQAFQEETEAKGKWRRATLSQVQLTSYYTGYKEIYEFRESLKDELGEKFDLKAFHNEFLSYGSAPVKIIKMLMTETEQ